MSVKLFIGNLSFKASEDALRDLFSEAGEVVSARIITDRETGRSRGFGFVEMNTKEEADKAIQLFDNYALVGREIKVSEAKPREEGSQSRGSYSRSGGGDGGGNYSNRNDDNYQA